MSRGPGRWQRLIIDAVKEHPEGVVLTGPDHSPAEQNAIRRAAARLEADGCIAIAPVKIDGRPRLVAYPPDADLPEFREIVGINGKTYRMPL